MRYINWHLHLHLGSLLPSLVVSGGNRGIDCGRRRRNVYGKKPQRYSKHNRIAHLTARSNKSVAYVTNNKRLYSTFCTVEANYWQTRSIARPVCDSIATCSVYDLDVTAAITFALITSIWLHSLMTYRITSRACCSVIGYNTLRHARRNQDKKLSYYWDSSRYDKASDSGRYAKHNCKPKYDVCKFCFTNTRYSHNVEFCIQLYYVG